MLSVDGQVCSRSEPACSINTRLVDNVTLKTRAANNKDICREWCGGVGTVGLRVGWGRGLSIRDVLSDWVRIIDSGSSTLETDNPSIYFCSERVGMLVACSTDSSMQQRFLQEQNDTDCQIQLIFSHRRPSSNHSPLARHEMETLTKIRKQKRLKIEQILIMIPARVRMEIKFHKYLDVVSSQPNHLLAYHDHLPACIVLLRSIAIYSRSCANVEKISRQW